MNGHVSPWMDDELSIFREAAARFLDAEMVPNDPQWRKQQNVGAEIWRKAGALGFLCTDVSAEFGGGGGDFRHEAVLYGELGRRGLSGFGQGVLTTWSITARRSRSGAFCRAWPRAN